MEVGQFFSVILVLRGVLENCTHWFAWSFVGFYYPALHNVRVAYNLFIVCACGLAYAFFVLFVLAWVLSRGLFYLS